MQPVQHSLPFEDRRISLVAIAAACMRRYWLGKLFSQLGSSSIYAAIARASNAMAILLYLLPAFFASCFGELPLYKLECIHGGKRRTIWLQLSLESLTPNP